MSAMAVDFSELDSVQAGDELVVRFTPRAFEDLRYLVGMNNAGVLDLSPGDILVLLAVADTGDWEWDNNRSMTLKVGPSWSRTWFEGRMSRALESLEIRRRR